MPYPGHLKYKCGTGRAGVECSDAELTATVLGCPRLSACMPCPGAAAPRAPPSAPSRHPLPAGQALVNVASNMCMLPAIHAAVLQGLRFEAGAQWRAVCGCAARGARSEGCCAHAHSGRGVCHLGVEPLPLLRAHRVPNIRHE